MAKKRSQSQLDKIISGTWYDFNAAFSEQQFSIEELEYLLKIEMSTSARWSVSLRLHQRLCNERMLKERAALRAQCESKGRA